MQKPYADLLSRLSLTQSAAKKAAILRFFEGLSIEPSPQHLLDTSRYNEQHPDVADYINDIIVTCNDLDGCGTLLELR